MPYSSVASLPKPVRDKLSGKKLRQWMHVFNSAFASHGAESIAFAEAWAAVRKGEAGYTALGKTNNMNDFHFFLPIAKVDREKRTVSGYASTPTKDSDGEIVSLDAIRAALPSYLEYGNIREMHALKAVGVAAETNIDKKGLYLTAYISDDQAWKKCLPAKQADGTELPATYKGFSIGGRKIDKEGDTITAIELSEISIVDRPANPDCRIEIAKSAKKAEEEEAGGYLIKINKRSAQQKALAKMARAVEILAKEGPPAAHDGFSLPAKPNDNPSPRDPSVENNKASGNSAPCEVHGKIGCEKCAAEKKAADDAAAGATQAKPPLVAPTAVEGKKKKKAKEAKKLAKAQLEASLSLQGQGFLYLGKNMRTVGTLSYAFDSLREAQRSLMMEGKREGGDKKDQGLANKLGGIAKDLAGVIGQKAEHEGEEAMSLTDADDSYLTTYLGEDFNMDKTTTISTGDPILDAINNLVKRASMPTRKAVMDSAKEDCTKSRKAMKECRKAIEEVHKMLKTSYISKMEKAKKGEKDSDGEFDHAGAMSKLQEAFGKAEEARTFGKASIAKMTKAEGMPGRSGQAGTEAGDAAPGFYEVPPGVKNLTPADLATASPGGRESGSAPPQYPLDGGVFPGKAAGGDFDIRKFMDKDGRVPANVAELVMKGAAAAAEAEAFRGISRTQFGGGGRRPMAFDMNKAFGGGEGTRPTDVAALNKALFDGVDVGAIGSGDEDAHNGASARAIGNLLTSGGFGKSILDPTFKGLAGMGRKG